MNDMIAEIVARRRDRAIAVLLGIKEREVDQYLPPPVKARMRKAILDQVNDLHGFFVDVMKSLDTGEVVINDIYLEKLDQMYRDVSVIRTMVSTSNGQNGS